MSTKAKVTATLNLDTKEWTRELTKGKEQLRAFQTGIASIKLRKIPMPEMEAPRAGGFGRFEHMRGQWEQFSKKNMADLGGSSRSAAGGILELSRAFEDAQYGMAGVLNNIPSIVQQFGGGAGLAGAASIAAVSLVLLYKSWNYLKSAMDGDPAAQAAASLRKLEAAQRETNRRIEESVALYERQRGAGLSAREDGGMDWMEQEVEQTNQLAEAEGKLNAARIAAAGGPQAAAKERARAMAEESAALSRQIALMDKRNEVEKERIRDSAARIAALKAEIDAAPKTSFATVDSQGNRQTRVRYNDEAAGKALEEKLRIEEQRRAELEGRINENTRARDDAAFRRDKVMPLEKAAADAEAENRREQDRKQQHEDQIKRFDEWGESMRAATEETKKEVQAMRDKAAAAAAAQQTTREDAAIANARARGHTSKANRLEREATRKRRQKALEDEGFSPQEAQNIARQEERDKRGASGQRIGENRAPSGLDAFDFAPRRPQTPTPDARPRPRDNPPPEANGGKGGSGFADMIAALKTGLATVTAKLEELKNANAAPVADAVKPVNG